ncbi:MAG: exodeoxyribonuclease VII small subunit [Clostridia bacterium]|nr:exodeoxyribonuclease VII small subunit [Clostridia bacterium]
MEFEQLLKQLEETVAKLDDANTTLDEGIALFDKGIVLGKECLDLLTESKGKVMLLQKKLDEITQTELKVEEE